MGFYNVPSGTPISEEEAKRIAYLRLNLEKPSMFGSSFLDRAIKYEGITWQGDHGVQHYKTWDELGLYFTEDGQLIKIGKKKKKERKIEQDSL